MATLLLWLGFEAGVIDERLWQALEHRALARAPGEVSRHSSERLRAIAIRHRPQAPAPLRILADGVCLLADLGFDASTPALLADVQDSPATVIHADPVMGRLRLLRDRLGQRPLVWTRIPGGVLAASGEHLLLAHPQIQGEWNPDYLAAYFGAGAPPARCSVFRGIHALAPGECIDIGADTQNATFSLLQPDLSLAAMSETALIDGLRGLLQAAVVQDLRQSDRVGVSLSAGLDSCSVAAWLPDTERQRVVAYTYGCDRIAELDERALAARLAQDLGIEHQGFAIDALGPLMPSGRRPVCPDTPISNPYREIKCALYSRAQAAGIDALLTGHFGDHLQPEPGDWLQSALRHRAFGLILRRHAALLRSGGPLALWREPGWRRCLAGTQRSTRVAPWLRPEWRARLHAARTDTLAQYRQWPQPVQAAQTLGSYAAIDAAGECYYSAQYGIDVRHPYRHVGLVRYCLSLPAHLSAHPGQGKALVRAALHGVLPEPWRQRPKNTSMQPLFDASVFGSERKQVDALIAIGQPQWSEYVDPAWLAIGRSQQRGEAPGLLRWLLAGFGLWLATQSQPPD